jgi:UPF0716 protein FxsA
MGLILLAAFIAVPLVEIGVFIQVGGWIGLWPTLAIVVITAVGGTALLRAQGLAVMNRARSQMDRGVMPARELFDGFCLVFAGALLLTPGFVTDAVGLLLFVQPVRDLLRGYATRYVERHGRVYAAQGPYGAQGPRGPEGPAGPDPRRDAGVTPPPNPGRGWGRPAGGAQTGGPTIEGDYRELGDDDRAGDTPGEAPRDKGGNGQGGNGQGGNGPGGDGQADGQSGSPGRGPKDGRG